MLDDKPKLKKFIHWLLTNELTCRPRWWARVFVNPFFIKRGRGSVIRHSARLDLIPSKKFVVGNHCVVETRTTINNQVGDVIIEDGSMITTGVTIVGPVHIGKNVIVGNGTLIFGMWHNYENPALPVSAQGCKH
jgi:acetyltransferase-like isoleucine patch superfamily enzyme